MNSLLKMLNLLVKIYRTGKISPFLSKLVMIKLMIMSNEEESENEYNGGEEEEEEEEEEETTLSKALEMADKFRMLYLR